MLVQLPLKGYGVATVGAGFVAVFIRWIQRVRAKARRNEPTIDELKMLFGLLLLLVVAFLCAAIALGQVQEQTSFGLTQIITVLAGLGGGFAQWAFSHGKVEPPKNKEEDKKDE